MHIIVPSSRIARFARPVLLPGWDDAPVDRPRRRSEWWRRLLSGAAGLTRLQPGTCCGCAPPPNCGTCTVPSPMFLTDSFTTISLTGGGGISTACYLMPVAAAATPCDCLNSLTPTVGASMLIQYTVNFFGSGGGTGCSVSISRGWRACLSDWATVAGGRFYYCVDQYTGCVHDTTTCTRLSPPNPTSGTSVIRCGDSGIGTQPTDFYSGALTSCTFPMSFTLALDNQATANGTLASPLGSGVTISS